ncbi:hypothetical protein QJS10_CPA05g00313 [Acorus calamus]|uniref:Bet v I/Major latex protein domain-containing protein n=1 Tax=Acorus calamus TaxID=4465 RepID=A0AAV9EQ55_ACOCL|nr:hypothetical protein QJS10_CPA05g00313 [Acorus calamus]
MIVKGFKNEFKSPVSAARMFKAGVIDSPNLVPKLIPAIIKEIIIDGDGKAGSTKRTNFTDAINFGYAKDHIDVLDEENFLFKYSLLEGGRLGKKYEAATYEVSFEESDDGGCVCKMAGTFNAYSDEGFNEDDINVGRNGVFGMYKAVEAYLIANPDAYA